MSKKTLITVGILVILTVAGVTGYFVLNSRSVSNSTTGERSLSVPPKSSKEEVLADILYEDSAGFSFKYPKALKVTDVTPDGDEYYTELNLSRENEKVVVTVKDTLAKTVEDWLKSDSTYSGASLVGATTLGGISAKQYSKGENLITVAVDAGVVYLIVGFKDDGFWEDVQSAFISTFKFSGAASSSGASSGGTSDINYEEEEVVE